MKLLASGFCSHLGSETEIFESSSLCVTLTFKQVHKSFFNITSEANKTKIRKAIEKINETKTFLQRSTKLTSL